MSSTRPDYSVFERFDFERKPVGVKFLSTRLDGVSRLDKVLDFCEMLVEAQEGRAFYATKEEFTCIGPLLLGMVAEDPIFESGQVGPRLEAFKEVRANRRIYQYLPRLRKNVIRYVVFAPVDKISFEPDILVMAANLDQAEILLRARGYATGEAWSARGTTVAGCSWLFLYPYLNGEMNVTFPSFGMKARRLFPDNTVLITIPWDLLSLMIDNLRDMNWVPHSYTIGGAEHKKKVRGIVEEIRKGMQEG